MNKEKLNAKLELGLIIIMVWNFSIGSAFLWDDYCMEVKTDYGLIIWTILSAVYLMIWLNMSTFVKRGLAVDI